MLLRRFTEHVRKQNWFAVALDLIVVVVGIYIGLQADAWMSLQKDRALEREYLERLLADMEESIEAQRETLAIFDNSIVATDYIAQLQRAGTFEGVDEERLIQGLNSLNWLAPNVTNMITIRELQSTGNISLIRDTEILQALGRFERSHAGVDFNAQQIVPLLAATASESMTWSFMEPKIPGEHTSVNETIDPSYGYVHRWDTDRMLQNPDGPNITSFMSGWAKYYGALLVGHHEETIVFRDLLREKLEK